MQPIETRPSGDALRRPGADEIGAIAGMRQQVVVGEGEKMEFWMPESPSGARVEVIVLVEAEGRGTAVFWFSTAANRDRWLQALWKIDDPTGYVCWIVSDGY